MMGLAIVVARTSHRTTRDSSRPAFTRREAGNAHYPIFAAAPRRKRPSGKPGPTAVPTRWPARCRAALPARRIGLKGAGGGDAIGGKIAVSFRPLSPFIPFNSDDE